ncbi:MAG: uroporphyrinogen decarboxylase family protein, partial [Desulfatiglandales bacterium]|nr:uroporphyrinogen decarboxylase family protein [Desulfatiglandales bacterium]
MNNEEMIYVSAARGRRPKTIPIVIEIQSVTAPSNKKLREKYGPENVWRNPELSAQCTIAPINEVGYDAAIHVSDLSILIDAMGLKVKPSETHGPMIENPVRTMADVDRLIIPEPEEAMKVWLEAMRIAKQELTGKVPLIGWVGGPLSVASFMIEGGFSGGATPYHHMKTMMHAEPKTFHKLFSKLTDVFVRFIPCQVAAGADVMMILDLHAPTVISP